MLEVAANVKHTLETITMSEVYNVCELSITSSYSANPHAAPDEDRILRELAPILGSGTWAGRNR